MFIFTTSIYCLNGVPAEAILIPLLPVKDNVHSKVKSHYWVLLASCLELSVVL